MKKLELNEIQQVSGGDALGDGLVCAGSLGVMFASDGLAATMGAGVAALGSCIDFGSDLGFGGGGGGGGGGIFCYGHPTDEVE